MLSEDYIIVQVNHVHDVLWVVFLEELKNFELNTRLIVVLLLILDDFNRHIYAIFVVEAFQCCAKRALSKEALYFKPVSDVVISDDLVVTFVIIVAVVVLLLGATLSFLGGRCTYEIYFRVVEDLLLLIFSQLVGEVDQRLLWRHRELRDLGLVVRRRLGLKAEGSPDNVDTGVRAITIGPLI